MSKMLTAAKKISHNNDQSMDAVSSMNIKVHAFTKLSRMHIIGCD